MLRVWGCCTPLPRLVPLSAALNDGLGRPRRNVKAWRRPPSVGVWGLAITLAGFSVFSLVLTLFFLALAGAADAVSAVFRGSMLVQETPDRSVGSRVVGEPHGGRRWALWSGTSRPDLRPARWAPQDP